MHHMNPILDDGRTRSALFPIRYPTAYKEAQKSFWSAEDIDLSSDFADWTGVLDDAERGLLSVILALFALSDGFVADNIVHQFSAEVQVPEVRCFYGFQVMMENVHAETYARALQEVVLDEEELDRLFNAVETIPSVKDKAIWCLKWFHRGSHSLGTRLIAFAIVEGLFFSSSFATLLWIKSRGLLPGLCHSNDLVMQDEARHTDFACKLFKLTTEEVPEVTVHSMVAEAVALEQAFFVSALPTGLCGMNTGLMHVYVEYVADIILWKLGYAALYNRKNPFPFMNGSSIPSLAQNFDRPTSDYHGGAVDAFLFHGVQMV